MAINPYLVALNAILLLCFRTAHAENLSGEKPSLGRDFGPDLMLLYQGCELTGGELEDEMVANLIKSEPKLQDRREKKRRLTAELRTRKRRGDKKRRLTAELRTRKLQTAEDVRLYSQHLSEQLLREWHLESEEEGTIGRLLMERERLPGLDGEMISFLDNEGEFVDKLTSTVKKLYEGVNCVKAIDTRSTDPERTPPFSKRSDHIDATSADVPSSLQIKKKKTISHPHEAAGDLIRSIDEIQDLGLTAKMNPDPRNSFEVDDEFGHLQWYLGGPEDDQPYGANILSAISLMYTGSPRGSLAAVKNVEKTQKVVIVDMGCGANDDLAYDATSPYCDEIMDQNEFLIDTDEAKAELGLPLDTLENLRVAGRRRLSELSLSASNCVERHLPNESVGNESYFSDSTGHGTGTNSLIGAGFNDTIGISGVCPSCRVKCVKISSDDHGVNMAGIFRSLSWIAEQSEIYPISNHSYGGFHLTEAELEGHRILSEKGHLVITSAGNYGCDLDPLSERYSAFSAEGIDLSVLYDKATVNGSCKDPDDSDKTVSEPFMPASVQLPTKIDVGSIGMNGKLSKFSNYGPKSIELAAPGETIVSLLSTLELDEAELMDPSAGIAVQNGTSFSAPIVAGSAGLVRQRMIDLCHESPSAESIVQTLLNSAKTWPDLKWAVNDGKTLDVLSAIESVEDLC